MADYFISGDGDNTNGLTPATAYTDPRQQFVQGQTYEVGDIIWIHRSSPIAVSLFESMTVDVNVDQTSASFGANYTDLMYTGIVHIVGWPAPGEPYYDIRPAAGISAGWDADRTNNGKSYIWLDGGSTRATIWLQGGGQGVSFSIANLILQCDNPSFSSAVWFEHQYAEYTHRVTEHVLFENVDFTSSVGSTGTDQGYLNEQTITTYENCTQATSDPVGSFNDYSNYFLTWGAGLMRIIGSSFNYIGSAAHDMSDVLINIGCKFTNVDKSSMAGNYNDMTDRTITGTEGEYSGYPTYAVGNRRKWVANYWHEKTNGVEQAENLSQFYHHEMWQQNASEVDIAQYPGTTEIFRIQKSEESYQFPHETTNAFSAPIRQKSFKGTHFISTDSRPGSDSNYRIRVTCNCHSYAGAMLDYWDTVNQWATGHTLGTQFIPSTDTSKCIPPNMADAFRFQVDDSVSQVSMWIKVSGVDTGTYGGRLPTAETLRLVVCYPTTTGFKLEQSQQNVSSLDTWLEYTCAISCDLTPQQASEGFAFFYFEEAMDYPERLRANRYLTIPDWYLYIDPVVEKS